MFWNRASIFEESSFHLNLFFKLWFAREDIAVTAGRVLAESRVNVSTRSNFLGLLFKWETMMNSLPLFQLKSGKWDSWFVHMNSVEIRSTMMIVQRVRLRYQAFDGWEFWGEIFETSRSFTFYYTYIIRYCCWTTSCTTKDDDYPIVYRVLTSPGG